MPLVYAAPEPAWYHLKFVYEISIAFLRHPSLDPVIASKYIDMSFIAQVRRFQISRTQSNIHRPSNFSPRLIPPSVRYSQYYWKLYMPHWPNSDRALRASWAAFYSKLHTRMYTTMECAPYLILLPGKPSVHGLIRLPYLLIKSTHNCHFCFSSL